VNVDAAGGEDVVNPVEKPLERPIASAAAGKTDAAERFFLDLESRVPVNGDSAVALCPTGELL
jgi:hypothetical protein